MKQLSLIAIFLSAVMLLLPAVANAGKRDQRGNYKPHFQQSLSGGGHKRHKSNNKGQHRSYKRSKSYDDEPKYRTKNYKAKKNKRKSYKNNKRKKGYSQHRSNKRFNGRHNPKYRKHGYQGFKGHRKHKKSRKYKRYLKKSLRTFNDFLYDDYLDGCLPPRILRASLIDRGWHDFELMDRGPYRIVLFATSYNGKRYRLVVDACTGRIIRRNYLGRF